MSEVLYLQHVVLASAEQVNNEQMAVILMCHA